MFETETIINPDGKPPLEVDFTSPQMGNLSDVEADAVARDLGLTVLSGLRLRRCRDLGEHLNKMGAVKVARGQYLIAANRMEKVANKVVEMIDTSTNLKEVNDAMPNLVALERQIAANVRDLLQAGINAEVSRSAPQLPPPPTPILLQNNFISKGTHGHTANTED
jgi:hypothetical protein